MSLSKRIKSSRKSLGISQTALAVEIGVSRVSVTHWETGKAEPKSVQIKSLARMFSVTTDWLLGMDEVSQGQPTSITIKLKRGQSINIACDGDSQ